MATRQKPKRTADKGSSARTGRRPRRQVALPPPLTLQQELTLMARSGARSLTQALITVAVIVVVGTAAMALWSLRPIPGYSSDDVLAGSPFDVAFRVENTSPWFALANLKVSCVLAQVRASGIPPTLIDSVDAQFPTGAAHLEPGQSASFRCPFRSLIGHPITRDAEIVQRAEIYFHSKYDAPLLGSLRITDNSDHFFLNTRLLPPRWTNRVGD